MATLKELRDIRISKLNKLKKLGVNPYPSVVNKTHYIKEVVEQYDDLLDKEVTTVGYIVAIRKHGKLVFIDLKDSLNTLQLVINKDSIVENDYKNSEIGFEDLDLLDIGDYLQVTGLVKYSKSNEKSITVSKVRMLSKSLRPLPDKWDGLKDKDLKMRRRYVDTKTNDEVYLRFVRRAKFWQAHREFFAKHGFLEINIPVLENIPGGADANPFVTHMDAIDQDFYLRISHELYLKRLIGGGYNKVYEIGPRFRNEGFSDEHLPEHIAMEFYWAYANWEEGMEFVKELFNYVIEYVYKDKKVFKIRGFEVDFSKEWELIDFTKLMAERYDGLDVTNTNIDELKKLCDKYNVKGDFELNISRAVDYLWKEVRKTIGGPAFLINHPKYLSPLAKAQVDRPYLTERFQPIIAGSELGNGWSEINDPQDQLERFLEQQRLRDAGDNEAQWLDIDYVEMLEYGMPPTFGWGHAERVFWFLEDVSAREGVPFTQLKHYIDDTTKEIYNLKDLNIQTKNSKSHTKKQTSNENEADQDLDDLNEDKGVVPSVDEALALLEKHVKDDYQLKHAKMVAKALKAYAKKLNQDENLWEVTGLLHDLDYYEYPEEHPNKSLEWFRNSNYSKDMMHAISAHAHTKTGTKPKTDLANYLIAIDELVGFLYAYSLMRPEGFKGMKPSSVKKKFKDKTFAAKIDRDEIMFGVNNLNLDFDEHIQFLVDLFLLEGV